MKIKKNSIVFIVIIIISIITITTKFNDKLSDDMYVLSKSESKSDKNADTDTGDDINIVKKENVNDEQSTLDKESNTKEEKITDNKDIVVQISGEVKKPGVITTTSDKRLIDIVEEVGGLTKDADLTKVNLSVMIEDQMNYIIPGKEDVILNNQNTSSQTSNTNKTNQSNDKNTLININIASIEELDELPGVGEATAQKIINHREENGNFKSIEEIKDVNGIGDKKFDDLKGYISIQ